MCFRRKKNNDSRFYEEEPIETRIKLINKLVSGISTDAECERLKNAVGSIFNARRDLKEIKTDDDVIASTEGFMDMEKEGQ